MADEKNVVKGQEEKQNFFTKLINFFKKLPGAIARPFKNMWHELRKVTWPSRSDVVKYSLIVLAFMVFMGVVIGLLDLGSTALVKVITPTTAYDEQVAAQEELMALLAEEQAALQAEEEAHDHEHEEGTEPAADEAVEATAEPADEEAQAPAEQEGAADQQ
ncbi:MAG: preprotein translocase subunit SecE [Clostridia bacterium]|nr:preprotein translocase subunit SecE [Clostridia bacterium]